MISGENNILVIVLHVKDQTMYMEMIIKMIQITFNL